MWKYFKTPFPYVTLLSALTDCEICQCIINTDFPVYWTVVKMKHTLVKRSLIISVITILIISDIISILLFSMYISSREQSNSVEYAEKSMQQLASEKSKLMALTFERIELQVQQLALFTTHLIENGYDVPSQLSENYYKNENGTLSRKADPHVNPHEYSNIYAPAASANQSDVVKEINLTQELDDAFAQASESPNTSWVYLSTENGLLRCSPYIDLSEYFSDSHQQKNDSFYYEATEENNPDGDAIWTRPYNDYLGTGWIISCSKPIYDNNGKLFGVISIDLSMKSILESFFSDFTLGKTGNICWITEDGDINYDSGDRNHANDGGQLYNRNIIEDSKPAKASIIKSVIASGNDTGLRYYTENTNEKILAYSKINGSNDLLLIEMDRSEFAVPFRLDTSGMMIICLIDIFVAIIFAFILYERFYHPIQALVTTSQKMAGGNLDVSFENTGTSYYEIAELEKAFEAMNRSIKRSIGQLMAKQKEIDTILETIDEALMILDKNGNPIIKSKDIPGFTKNEISDIISTMEMTNKAYEEEIVVDGELFSNTYYPITLNNKLEKIVVSSKCVTSEVLMEKEMLQIEKMAGIGQISAAIVHELKNKLALIKGAAYIINMNDSSGENQEEIQVAMKAVTDAEDVINTLLDFSKRDVSEGEYVHIGTIVQQIALLSNKELISRNIKLETSINDEIYVFSSGRDAIKVIIQNVFNNAMQAIGENGIIKINCTQEAENTIITIWDNGGGIKLNPPEKIFEPFATTKEKGTGIGLWISKKLAASLSGRLTVKTFPEGASQFDLFLPTNKLDSE